MVHLSCVSESGFTTIDCVGADGPLETERTEGGNEEENRGRG